MALFFKTFKKFCLTAVDPTIGPSSNWIFNSCFFKDSIIGPAKLSWSFLNVWKSGNNKTNVADVSELTPESAGELLKAQGAFEQMVKSSAMDGTNFTEEQIEIIRQANEDLTDLIPEGIHQDGFNMIAICCVSRKNINGGVSRIYDKDKNIIYSQQLNQGEMIVINDVKNYHDVTNIELEDPRQIPFQLY